MESSIFFPVLESNQCLITFENTFLAADTYDTYVKKESANTLREVVSFFWVQQFPHQWGMLTRWVGMTQLHDQTFVVRSVRGALRIKAFNSIKLSCILHNSALLSAASKYPLTLTHLFYKWLSISSGHVQIVGMLQTMTMIISSTHNNGHKVSVIVMNQM